MALPPPNDPPPPSALIFFDGLRKSATSVFSLVLVGTYVGIGALGHDYGFSLPWVMRSTVRLSSVRLLPMVVALLPLIKGRTTRDRELLLTVHFTAATMWVESLRLLPGMPRERRIAFCNGLAVGFMVFAHVGTVVGFYLAASLPLLLTAGLLFLTPISFLVSTARNARFLVDRLALGLGLAVGPALAWAQIGLDLLWTGIIAGTAAYALDRLREALR